MRRALVAALATAVLAVGCGGGAERGRAPGELVPPGRPALRVTMSADRQSYAAGQPVVMTLTVENTGAAPIAITTPTAQLYDFSVLRGDREVWRWGADKGFAAQISEWTLAPGQQRQFSETWRSPAGLEPGDYVIVGQLAGGETLGVQPLHLPITLR